MEEWKMTRFEKDLKEALEGSEIAILTKRKAELENLKKQLRACRDGFRAQCLQQEITKLTAEYNKIDANF